ncbi:elevenin-like [Cylas formicarius]|uniref:elevenin-like n=1 Tax=Cylas formicarius TaxID=197179 RepID=UPI002958BA5C|nr:elevenin-like [Cylas formicarius]
MSRSSLIKIRRQLAIVLVLLITLAETRRLNCRIYVHHPKCRGVAAKRDTTSQAFSEELRDPRSPSGFDPDYLLDSIQQSPNLNENYEDFKILMALLRGPPSKTTPSDQVIGRYV